MVAYWFYGCLSALSPFLGTRKWYSYAFGAFLIFFIGFRFETGFDWPVYKTLFTDLQSGYSLTRTACYAQVYNQEYIFVAIMGAMAYIFHDYEWPQAIYSIIFISSLYTLGKSFKVSNITLFVALALSYIVFTVGFSTVRQSLAIAAFNFAIAAFLNRKNVLTLGLLVACVLFQYSSALYVVCFAVVALSYRRFRSPIVDASVFGAMIAGAALGGFILLKAPELGVAIAGDRVAYYVSLFTAQGVTKWDLAFSVVLIGIASHVMISTFFIDRSESDVFSSRLMLVLAAIAIAGIVVPILRERASYQMWIMYAVVLTSQPTILRRLAIGTAFAFSVYFSAAVPFRFPSTLMFVPYQNYLVGMATRVEYAQRQYDHFMGSYVELMVPGGTVQEQAAPSSEGSNDASAGKEPTGHQRAQSEGRITRAAARAQCSKI